ncbi:hypothetical protein ASG90_16430 [Nocardioides sp. Soil797]|nr:hypothetical protein ASG90_16430 [Nocardioides sp. Soil797]
MTSSMLPSAADRMASFHWQAKWCWGISLVLAVWLVAGFVRDPAATWYERFAVVLLILGFALAAALDIGSRRPLPALDRTSRMATLTGREAFSTEVEGDGVCDPYDLFTVTVEVDGSQVSSHLADIIAPESLARFTIGSTWHVHAFEEGPLCLSSGPADSRVILTEAHEDVVRDGYDLSRVSLRGSHGPGSELLLRRFANDPAS